MNDKNVFPGFDMSQLFSDLKMPGMDAGTLLDAQRRNIAAISDANEMLFVGFQEITRLQGEMMRAAVQTVQEEVASFAGASSPQEVMEKQTEIAKRAMETAMENLQRVADEAIKATGGAADALSQQFLTNLDEIKTPEKPQDTIKTPAKK